MNALPTALVAFCREHGYGAIQHVTPLGGGCINHAARLETDHGPLFLKVNHSAPSDMFEREAEGLATLAAARVAGGDGRCIRAPNVYAVGPDFILQEFIEPGLRQIDFWEVLGRQLAELHHNPSPRFGFAHNNYLGSTPQLNTWEEDGYTFFAEHRLRYQAELARRNHLLDAHIYSSLISLTSHISRLIPPQPASLIHGDLWSGNIHTGPQGEPVLIDPAAHYGWAEAELAMMTLFGSPPPAFFGAYESVRPLEPGYAERFDLYNLYHLLNHLNLFGESYISSVQTILQKYTS